MAWIAAGASILSSLGAGGAAKKAAKTDLKNKKILNEQEGGISRQNSQFNMELEYYYKQLDKKDKMRGLDEFRKFSTVKNFSPNYANTTAAPVLPTAPQATAGAYAPKIT